MNQTEKKPAPEPADESQQGTVTTSGVTSPVTSVDSSEPTGTDDKVADEKNLDARTKRANDYEELIHGTS